jgi:hypothetical protein
MSIMTVREKAQQLGTFRWLEVYLMETLARWVPTTPEMEVKVLFGRHIWDLAQHADALGKRAFELRAQLHYTVAPPAPYRSLMEELADLENTAERIHVFYDGVLPRLAARYRAYLDHTDDLLDEPSVRIVQRILEDGVRMRRESAEVLSEFPDIRLTDSTLPASWARREAEAAGIVAHGADGAVVRG